MPITLRFEGPVIHTCLSGRVTNEELFAHYALPVFSEPRGAWREIVDGRAITEMAVTAEGQQQLAQRAATRPGLLRNGRLAMVASADVTYGMFRMWEIRREHLNYSVCVFRDLATAREWLGLPAVEGPAERPL